MNIIGDAIITGMILNMGDDSVTASSVHSIFMIYAGDLRALPPYVAAVAYPRDFP